MKVTICAASVFVFALVAAPSLVAQSGDTQVERGKYLVGITGCHDCHSPKMPGTMKPVPDLILSGRPQTTKVPSAGPGEVHASEDFTAFTGGWALLRDTLEPIAVLAKQLVARISLVQGIALAGAVAVVIGIWLVSRTRAI